jgi:type III restriction enzyme
MAPVFNALLGSYDDAAKSIILKLLQPKVPVNRQDQELFFSPHMGNVDRRTIKHYEDMSRKLKRALIHGSVHSAIGLLRSCYDYALNDQNGLDGIFKAVNEAFTMPGAQKILDRVSSVNEFRNNYIAHHEKELTDKTLAEEQLKHWVETLTFLRV